MFSSACFQVAHRARRLEPLEAEVLGSALAGRFADEPGERQARLGLHLRRGGMGGEVAVQLGDQAQVQRTPFARDLVQVVALLPALQAVRLRVPGLFRAPAARLGRARRRGQRRRQPLEPGRQVIDELRPGQRVACRQVGIGRDRLTPGVEKGPDAAAEMCAQRGALGACVFTCQRSLPPRLGRPRPADCRRRDGSGKHAHPRLPVPLPGLGGGDEGAVVVGARTTPASGTTPAFCSSGWPPSSTAIALRWPKASRTKSIAAPSFDQAVAPASDRTSATASNSTDGVPASWPSAASGLPSASVTPPIFGATILTLAPAPRRRPCCSAATSGAVRAVGDQDADRAALQRVRSSCR